jgi:DNA-directed RNA polymerase specialized sigma24 family protein
MTEVGGPPSETYLSQNQKIEFEEFYMGEMPKLAAFTMRLGANLSEATDIAQQAFVNAYPRWPTILHPGAYLRTAASREFIRRSCGTIRETPVAELPDAAAMPDLSVAKVEFASFRLSTASRLGSDK